MCKKSCAINNHHNTCTYSKCYSYDTKYQIRYTY